MTDTLLPDSINTESSMSTLDRAKRLAALDDEGAFHKLLAMAVELEWTERQTILRHDSSRWNLSQSYGANRHPISVRAGGDHSWFRVPILTPGRAGSTMDLQPLFQPDLDLRTDDGVFVRVYCGPGTGVSPNLHVLMPSHEAPHSAILKSFSLPLGVDIQAVIVPQPNTNTEASPTP